LGYADPFTDGRGMPATLEAICARHSVQPVAAYHFSGCSEDFFGADIVHTLAIAGVLAACRHFIEVAVDAGAAGEPGLINV